MQEASNPARNDARFVARAAQRCEFRVDASLRLASGETSPFEIKNLSLGGLSGDASGFIAIGAEVEVIIPDESPISAQVIWQLGNSTGLKFASPLPVHRIIALSLAHLPLTDNNENPGAEA